MMKNIEGWRCFEGGERHYSLKDDLEIITFENNNYVTISYVDGAGCECITVTKKDIVKMFDILFFEELRGIGDE